jgi:NAD(P)-dependent dehydrogenase (short-subunit alcohol dehydrogenase family)
MRALVTGAGKRLGRAMALYLGARGYDVAVHYASSAADAEGVAEEIRRMGRKSATIRADLLVEDEASRLVDQAVAALGGPLSVLVNNASIFEYDTIPTATRSSWDRHIESNLRAPFVLTQNFAHQCAPTMQDEAGEPVASGLIVNMVDQRVLKPTPEFASYTVAKIALWALTQTAAQGLAPQIRVNAIGPGPTMRGVRQSQDHFLRQRQATILQRGAGASDVVAALGYFLDATAVTGQLICVDGGQHLAWRTPDVLGVE